MTLPPRPAPVTWLVTDLREVLQNAFSVLARSAAVGRSPPGLRAAASVFLSGSSTEGYGFAAATAGVTRPEAAELTALDVVLAWCSKYLSIEACKAGGLTADAGRIVCWRAAKRPWVRIGADRQAMWAGNPPRGNSRHTLEAIESAGLEYLARRLTDDKIPHSVVAPFMRVRGDAVLPASAPVPAMPRHMDGRPRLLNPQPCGRCDLFRADKDEPGIGKCRLTNADVSARLRAHAPQGEPCFVPKQETT